MSEHSDFLAAVQVEVDRYMFNALVEREFEQRDPVTGLVALLVPPDDTAPAVKGRGGCQTGDL